MSIASTLDRLHLSARQNKWMWYFTVFNRLALAAGFIPSGMVKILGERFTDLSNNHPLGAYLEALHHTGYYYTFIGVLQFAAAILLLIPRTALLGALIYFPIILNIFILSLSVRFQGSLLTAPFMVLANVYLLCWDYHKLKFILPLKHPTPPVVIPITDHRFPFRFFAGVLTTIVVVVCILVNAWSIMPFNTLGHCRSQCPDNSRPQACYHFCDCIHEKGRPLDQCLDEFYRAEK